MIELSADPESQCKGSLSVVSGHRMLNIALSLLAGGMFGYVWAERRQRPRSLGGIIAVAILMIISPWIMVHWRIVWINGYGILGNFTLLGVTAVILFVAVWQRYLRPADDTESDGLRDAADR